jgi:hypothetical protein
MPHLRLAGTPDLRAVADSLPRDARRWGRAVLKTEECWLRRDGGALLVEGTVVELARPLHPVALVAGDGRSDSTTIRLWSRVVVERTPAVQRWLCLVAADLVALGCGELQASNVSEELRRDLVG